MSERQFSGRKEGRSFWTGEKEQRETNHDHGKPNRDPAPHGQKTENRPARGNGLATSLFVGSIRTGRLFRRPSTDPIPGGPGNLPFTEFIVLQAHRLSRCINRYHDRVNERENQEAIGHGDVDKQPVFERPLECLLAIEGILEVDQDP